MFTTPYFLGLDASTQALKASLLSADLDVIKEVAINFDADLPQYKTKGGVLLGKEGSGEVFSPALMVVEAMDLLFDKIKAAGWEVEKVRGIAAAGQVRLFSPGPSPTPTKLIDLATRFCLLVETSIHHTFLHHRFQTPLTTIHLGILPPNDSKLARLLYYISMPSHRGETWRSRSRCSANRFQSP
jgi:hypothetical protein